MLPVPVASRGGFCVPVAQGFASNGNRSSAGPRLPALTRRGRCGAAKRSYSLPCPRAATFSEHLDDVAVVGGSGGGNGGRLGNNRKFTAEDGGGGGFFEYNALVDILVKGGVALSELPRDLQEAMSLGLMSIKDLHLWMDISAIPVLGNICRMAPAVRDRVMGNPRFVMQLFVELALGLSAKTVAEMKARGDKCFKEELPFFLSDLALEAIADSALVFLLSPKRSFKALPSNRLARGIARLPGHSLQSGAYTATERAMTVIYRTCQFFVVGVVTSAIGHSVTKLAVEQQQQKHGSKDDVHLAPVLDNSLGFGAFMGLSSNLRYQTVNGIEERVLEAFVPHRGFNALATFILRFSNCYFGGVQWVWFAKKIGLQ